MVQQTDAHIAASNRQGPCPVAKSSAPTQICALRGDWRAIKGANRADNGQKAQSNLARHLIIEVEEADKLHQTNSLLTHCNAGRGDFFNQRRILLGNFIHL